MEIKIRDFTERGNENNIRYNKKERTEIDVRWKEYLRFDDKDTSWVSQGGGYSDRCVNNNRFRKDPVAYFRNSYSADHNTYCTVALHLNAWRV
jgi:hypothetical protein